MRLASSAVPQVLVTGERGAGCAGRGIRAAEGQRLEAGVLPGGVEGRPSSARALPTAVVSMLAAAAARLTPAQAEIAGARLGHLRHRLCPAEARAVRENLRWLGLANCGARAPGGDAAEHLSREIFRSFGLFAIEFLRSLAMDAGEVASGWEIDGWEHLESLAAQPAGFILVTAHTGNWEHLCALGPLLGRRAVVPTGVQMHRWLSPALKSRKQRWGIVSVSPRGDLRSLLHAIAAGGLVGLPLDGGSFRRGLPVPLLGRRVRLPAGPARLALASGRPIVPVFARRAGFMRQQVRIAPPLWPPSERECARGAAARALTARLAALLGEHLRATADQWCIFRPLREPAESGRAFPARRRL
jgi:lauroyl/myristoyl acyltransferase